MHSARRGCGVTVAHTLVTDFSNILSKTAIERLADADDYEVVREVQVSEWFPSCHGAVPICITGILCGLCTRTPLSILPEPHTVSTNAIVWRFA